MLSSDILSLTTILYDVTNTLIVLAVATEGSVVLSATIMLPDFDSVMLPHTI